MHIYNPSTVSKMVHVCQLLGSLHELRYRMVYIMISGPAIWGKMQPIDETVNSYSRSAPSLHNWTSLATHYGLRWDKCDVLTSVLIHRSVELTAQSSKGLREWVVQLAVISPCLCVCHLQHPWLVVQRCPPTPKAVKTKVLPKEMGVSHPVYCSAVSSGPVGLQHRRALLE